MTGYQDGPLWSDTWPWPWLVTFIIINIQFYLEWDKNKFNSNQIEDQIGTVLHWSNHKEPKQAKSKDQEEPG